MKPRLFRSRAQRYLTTISPLLPPPPPPAIIFEFPPSAVPTVGDIALAPATVDHRIEMMRYLHTQVYATRFSGSHQMICKVLLVFICGLVHSLVPFLLDSLLCLATLMLCRYKICSPQMKINIVLHPHVFPDPHKIYASFRRL